MIRHTVTAVLFAAIAAGSARAADALTAFAWKQRAVVVFADSHRDLLFQRQVARLKAQQRLLDDYETRLVAVAGHDPALRRKLGVPDAGFAVVLVGKDGGAKQTWRAPVEPARIFGLIDAMPMRRDEVRARR